MGLMRLFVAAACAIVVLPLECGSGAQVRTDPASRAARMLELGHQNELQVADVDIHAGDFIGVATGGEDGIAPSLYLFEGKPGREEITWQVGPEGGYLSAVVPWMIYHGRGERKDINGYLIITTGGLGIRYGVRFLAYVDGKPKILLETVGWGAPYMPELAYLGPYGQQSIIVPDMDDYRQPHRHAIVYTWDVEKQKFVERVVPWADRFKRMGGE
jgi:hypothetical protein